MSNKRLELINKNKSLVAENNELKAIIESNSEMMDRVKPILECVVPFVLNNQNNIEASINDYDTLQPALDAILEFEESEDEI